MNDFESGPLQIKIKKVNSHHTMEWLGMSVDQSPEKALTGFLDELISVAKGTELHIDFTKMEYMNSSTVVPIFYLLKELFKLQSPMTLF